MASRKYIVLCISILPKTVTGKTVSLSSANPKYEAIQVRSDLVRILGKAIAVIKEN